MQAKLKAVRALLDQGMPKPEIARQLGIGRTTLHIAIKLLRVCARRVSYNSQGPTPQAKSLPLAVVPKRSTFLDDQG